MKKFSFRDIEAAVSHAADGHQALHLHGVIVDWESAPECFRVAVSNNNVIGHLFDQDAARLISTAKRLGVRVVYVDSAGTPFQHIDLCRKPLERAVAECDGNLF